MLEYRILTSVSTFELSTAVNDHIKSGWKPLGGLAIALMDRGQKLTSVREYVQAIVKEKDTDTNG